jgi:hypothetical protein
MVLEIQMVMVEEAVLAEIMVQLEQLLMALEVLMVEVVLVILADKVDQVLDLDTSIIIL